MYLRRVRLYRIYIRTISGNKIHFCTNCQHQCLQIMWSHRHQVTPKSLKDRRIPFKNERQLLQKYFYSLTNLIGNGWVSIQIRCHTATFLSWSAPIHRKASSKAAITLQSFSEKSNFLFNIKYFNINSSDIHTGALTTTKTDQNLEILMNM